jgi:hypothetical protein
MKSKGIFTLAFIFILFYSFKSIAQVEPKEKEKFLPHHLFGVAISHAHVFAGKDANGDKAVLSMPSLGFDYTYQFRPKWGIGLHTDLILEEFLIEKSGGGEVIERNYPIAPAIMGIYKPGKHLQFLFGAGVEFEQEENFFLNRAGVEYTGELPKGWEVYGALNYDFKWNAYDTWVLGIGIAKSFGGSRKNK